MALEEGSSVWNQARADFEIEQQKLAQARKELEARINSSMKTVPTAFRSEILPAMRFHGLPRLEAGLKPTTSTVSVAPSGHFRAAGLTMHFSASATPGVPRT